MPRRILLITLAVLGLLAAPAAAQYSFIVTPGEVQPGGTISIEGEGCSPGETVTVTISPVSDADAAAAAAPIVLGETVADSDGTFSLEAVIPDDLDPGDHTVTATCGEHVLTATITVNDTPADPEDDEPTPPGDQKPTPPGDGTGGDGGGTGGGGGGGGLPTTGSDVGRYVLIGAGLLAVGGFFLIGTRRRRTA